MRDMSASAACPAMLRLMTRGVPPAPRPSQPWVSANQTPGVCKPMGATSGHVIAPAHGGHAWSQVTLWRVRSGYYGNKQGWARGLNVFWVRVQFLVGCAMVYIYTRKAERARAVLPTSCKQSLKAADMGSNQLLPTI